MFRHFPACSIIFHEKTWPHSPWHTHLPWPFHMPWRWPWDPGFRSGPSFRSSWSAWSKRPPAAELKKVGCIWRWSWLQLAGCHQVYKSHQITVYILYTITNISYIYIYVYYNIQYQTPVKTNTKMTNMIHLDLQYLYYLAAASWLEGFTGLSRLRMP